MTECTICAETYNRSTRLPVKCEYCEFIACRKCCQTFLLNEPVSKCMNQSCGREWTRHFLVRHFTQTFNKHELKEHRSQVLFDRERSMLPATQPLVEMHHEHRRLSEHIIDLEREMSRISDELRRITHQRYLIRRRLDTGIAEDGIVQNTRLDFVRACPDPECRGYLSTQWKCGVCEKWTCNQCHEIKGVTRDSPHECKPENVASAALISRETRPCPSCHTHIFKIEGCFGRNTRVLMHDGTVRFAQDIRVGDWLKGDNGEPRIVKQLSRGQDWMYEIQQSNGMSYVVSSYHQLVFMVKGAGGAKLEKKLVYFTVNDYLRLHPYVKRSLYGVNAKGTTSELRIEPRGKAPFYGWTTDGNRLFLLADHTIVHNCNQMFCTKCNTPFDWRTGQPINGPVHNPHYFEWMRQRNQNEGVAPHPVMGEANCNMQLTNRLVQNILELTRGNVVEVAETRARNSETRFPIRSAVERRIGNICRNTLHLQHVIVPQYEVNFIRVNERLRVKYLMNEIDEAKFKSAIQCNDKRNQQNIELVNVFEMMYRTVTDIMYRLRDDLQQHTGTDCNPYFSEIDRIVEYANGHLAEISMTYGSTVVHTFNNQLNHQVVQRVKRRITEDTDEATEVATSH